MNEQEQHRQSMRAPAEVFHPGKYLREEIGERGCSLQDLAESSGLTLPEIRGVLDGTIPTTGRIAERLAVAVGPPAEFWTNLQKAYDAR